MGGGDQIYQNMKSIMDHPLQSNTIMQYIPGFITILSFSPLLILAFGVEILFEAKAARFTSPTKSSMTCRMRSMSNGALMKKRKYVNQIKVEEFTVFKRSN